MNLSSMSCVTNPFLKRIAQNKIEINKCKNDQKQLSQNTEDAFEKTENGFYISEGYDPKTGDTFVAITKYNWSNEGVLDSTEVTKIPDSNQSIGQKTITDYEHNAISQSLIKEPDTGMEVHKELITERKDPITGKTVAKQTYKMSDISGIYNVEETDALGRKKTLSSAIKTPEGAIYISKNLTSLDGTTTTYRYSKDASGNHIRTYNQIKDKQGNVLSTIDRTYDRVNENLAYSSVNGRKYTIEQQEKNTVVTDELTGEKTVINAKMFNIPFYKKPMFSFLERKVGYIPERSKEPVASELLKILPGDTLVNMTKNVKYIDPLKNDSQSGFMGRYGVLYCKTNGFAVNHELGHSMDSHLKSERKDFDKKVKEAILKGEKAPEFVRNPIADNPQFKKEYVAEKAAFIKAFPSFKEDYIDYFIYGVEGQFARGKKETVAETNAIISQTPVPSEELAMRTQVLQQYFPRTIAVATKLMTPIAVPKQN